MNKERLVSLITMLRNTAREMYSVADALSVATSNTVETQSPARVKRYPAEICKHCKEPIELRNPSGKCDHLHYPENCRFCSRKGYTQ